MEAGDTSQAEQTPDSAPHSVPTAFGQEALCRCMTGARVLVTGGSGFVGRHLLPRLQALGATVFAPTHAELDLSDARATVQAFEALRPELVFHLAALQGGVAFINRAPASLFFENIQVNINTIEAARRSGASRIVCMGSSCLYPDSLDTDLSESDVWSGPMHDSVAHYGMTKKVELLQLRACLAQSGLQGAILVPSSLIGEGDDFSPDRSHVGGALIRKFVLAVEEAQPEVVLWGDGSPVRELQYVGDAVEAALRVMALPELPPLLNIGVGHGISIRAMAERIRTLTGFEGDLRWDTSRPSGAPRKVLCSTRALELLGDYRTVGLDEGLRRAVEHFRSSARARQSHLDTTPHSTLNPARRQGGET